MDKMGDETKKYETVAQHHRENGELIDAGNYYTAAGYVQFSNIWDLPEDLPTSREYPTGTSSLAVGRGAQYFLAGALCYRLADKLERCQNRCEQGILLVTDLLDNDLVWQEEESDALPGLAHEIIGDFRLYGDMNGYDDEYETAGTYYRKASPERAWQDETEFVFTISILIELARSIDYGLTEEMERQIRDISLQDRIEYKRDHYENIIEGVLAEGNWESDVI